MTDEYDFSIFIDPCKVQTYTATTKVTSITYNIGAPSLIAGRYVFDESPLCGYPETVTVTNLPSFATHKMFSSDFAIA